MESRMSLEAIILDIKILLAARGYSWDDSVQDKNALIYRQCVVYGATLKGYKTPAIAKVLNKTTMGLYNTKKGIKLALEGYNKELNSLLFLVDCRLT